jgi:hypothetical protein
MRLKDIHGRTGDVIGCEGERFLDFVLPEPQIVA